MQFGNKFLCYKNFVPQLTESEIEQHDCISITAGENKAEQMIFLGKVENEYEVRVYKANSEDSYVPHILDFKVKRYEANNEFASFFFDNFFFARRFVSLLEDLHPEYSLRPTQKSIN